jgi:hypothetical protein
MSIPEKVQYVVWGRGGAAHPSFAALVRAVAVELLRLGDFALKLTVTEARPPWLSTFPFCRRPVALLSLAGAGLPAPARCAELLAPCGDRLAGYRVVESTPRAYDRSWSDGEPSPGVCLLTLFRRRAGLADAELIRRWHEGHTSLTLRVHPVWCYVRNVVREPLFAGSPQFDGIVEEQFRERGELLDPVRFYGGALHMVPNMARVAVDIAGFIDLRTIETYLAVERVLRSSAPGRRA